MFSLSGLNLWLPEGRGHRIEYKIFKNHLKGEMRTKTLPNIICTNTESVCVRGLVGGRICRMCYTAV